MTSLTVCAQLLALGLDALHRNKESSERMRSLGCILARSLRKTSSTNRLVRHGDKLHLSFLRDKLPPFDGLCPESLQIVSVLLIVQIDK